MSNKLRQLEASAASSLHAASSGGKPAGAGVSDSDNDASDADGGGARSEGDGSQGRADSDSDCVVLADSDSALGGSEDGAEHPTSRGGASSDSDSD